MKKAILLTMRAIGRAAVIAQAVHNEVERQMRAVDFSSLPMDALTRITARLQSHIELCKAALARSQSASPALETPLRLETPVLGTAEAAIVAPVSSVAAAANSGGTAAVSSGNEASGCCDSHDGNNNIDDATLRDAIAVDCEMIQTEAQNNALARVCLISWEETVLLDMYAAPPGKVTDYLTRYSGIREHDLVGAPPAAEVRATVEAMIRGRVLIGHGLRNDLRALRLQHPAALTIDTTELCWGHGRALNLKALSLDILGDSIQRGGHSPYEDALTSLRLLKAHRRANGRAAELPPPRVVSLWLAALEEPSPPGCQVEAGQVGAGQAEAGQVGAAAAGRAAAAGSPTEWTLSLQWTSANVRALLEWYADGAHADDEGCARAPLRFAPSLPKEHRELLHKEAKRFGLSTHSEGLGEARAIRVLPRGVAPPEPAPATRRLAQLVYRWARDAAEQTTEGEAAPAPFSMGEVTEIIQLDDLSSVPPQIADLVATARAALGTAPPELDGKRIATRARDDYERKIALEGRLDAAANAVGGKAVKVGVDAAEGGSPRKNKKVDWRKTKKR